MFGSQYYQGIETILHQNPGTKTESVSFNWIFAVVHMKRINTIVFQL